MYGGQLGPQRIVYFILIFFIKHNNWSTLSYDVHLSTEQCILLVFQGIDNRLIGDNLPSDTHIIYKLKWCVRTFFIFK